MKHWLYIFSAVVLLFACQRSHSDNQLTGKQLNAVKEMASSYALAKVYNDSLMAAVNGSIPHADAAMTQHLESMYHHYDSQFETCHNTYDHNNSSADHSHGSSGMVQMHSQGGGMGSGGMMQGCNYSSNAGHDAALHEKMTALHQLHAGYHH